MEVKSDDSDKKEITGLVSNELQVNHRYMYQVQTQMLVTRIPCCDFLVKLPNGDIKVIFVKSNLQMQRDIIAKSTNFYKVVVLPELVVKYFSSQKHFVERKKCKCLKLYHSGCVCLPAATCCTNDKLF